MARYTARITADGDTFLCDILKPSDSSEKWGATVYIYGTFGGGTVTLVGSPDGGTTKVTLPNISGAAFSATTNAAVELEHGNGNKNTDAPKLYARVAGSAGATINVTVFDNRG